MSAFSTDQVFKSRKDIIEWVQNTARPLGYVIVTKRSKIKASGFVSKVILMCDRSGVYRSVKGTSKATSTKKTNCPFELVAKHTKESDTWVLHVIRDEHNHPPAQHMEGHPFVERFSNDEFNLVTDLTRKHVAPRDILGIIKEQNKDNVSRLKTVYNARNKIREIEHKGKTPMQVLMSHLHENGYIYYTSINSSSNELESLFFAHQTSFDLLCAFPHVMLMDATYKTNKYDMPFLQIVGVTSTNKTFSIAFAFMHKETKEIYIWVLECLKSILDKCMQPRVIVTDREYALMNACQQVFPNATRLLCRFHISQSIFRNCKSSFKSRHEWESFNKKWSLLIESQTFTSFTENYEQMQTMLIAYPGVLHYLQETWLNKHKEMFISFWTDLCLHFGNQTTNRVESAHAKLKVYLNSSRSTLDKFVSYIDEIVKSQYTAIKASFEKSRTVIKHEHNLPILKQLHGFVSRKALDIITEELQLNPAACGCQVRKSHGLPCACVASMHLNEDGYIPLDSINMFWRKLDMSPLTHEVNDEITCDVELKRFQQLFEKQSKPGKKILLAKLRGIIEPSIHSFEEPTVHKNTRGRPTLKKQQEKRRNIPQYPRKVSCSPKDSSCSYACNPLLKEIPDIFHAYITYVQDVKPDGNCGFRSIALCLGLSEDRWPEIRSELVDELSQDRYRVVFGTDYDEMYQSIYFTGTGSAPSSKWMIMPDTAVLISNRFGVIVHFLSKKGSSTCFPLWKGHEDFQDPRVISIAHVYSNHFIMVQLEGEFPMPPTMGLWNQYRHHSAISWKSVYKRRLDMFTTFVNRSTNEVIDV